MKLLASQAAISVKNAQLYGELQQENSERLKTQEGLRLSADELSRVQEGVRQASRAAMMGQLTVSLAHELNQPLGAILSNVQAERRLLADKKPDVEDASAALNDVEHLLRSDASTKEISFRLDLPPSLPVVVGNRTQLIEVLINLVSNAFDSVHENADGPREVELCASQCEPAQVHIAVRIDPETTPRC